jgi:hypothetical protein
VHPQSCEDGWLCSYSPLSLDRCWVSRFTTSLARVLIVFLARRLIARNIQARNVLAIRVQQRFLQSNVRHLPDIVDQYPCVFCFPQTLWLFLLPTKRVLTLPRQRLPDSVQTRSHVKKAVQQVGSLTPYGTFIYQGRP